tara:strand:+ start:1111 stop:1536 length:426 start_codon:yes stop_codon:yes gene_type:complete
MEGMYQDLIILVVISLFGVWVINKHYDNAWKIEQIDLQIKQLREIGDLTKMQNDIIEQNQNSINLNAKINRNEKWTVETIDKMKKAIDMLGEIQSKLVAFMDSCRIPSDGDVLHVQDVLDKMAEMGMQGQVKINPDEEANA